MCGIVGAITKERSVFPILLDGLSKLEYRGYDSTGLATLNADQPIYLHKVADKVDILKNNIEQNQHSTLGIAHARWATHGAPTEINAHPHLSYGMRVAIVHNGIIENAHNLRQELKDQGIKCVSETDSEIVAHLIEQQLDQGQTILETLNALENQLVGHYALGIILVEQPDTLYAVRVGSPLVIGTGVDENFIASDPLALACMTQRFIYLQDHDVAVLQHNRIMIYNHGENVKRKTQHTNLEAHDVSKGEYRHFMLKEIYEQPQAITNTLGYLIHEQKIDLISYFGKETKSWLPQIKRLHIVACGTSYHAGLVAKYWLESIAKIPTQVEIASEQRYRDIVVEDDTLLVALSQSGETADTLEAVRQSNGRGYAHTFAVSNVAQSSLVRETDSHILTQAGAEIGVAATKTFSAQLTALLVLSYAIADLKGILPDQKLNQLKQLPQTITTILKLDKIIQQHAQDFQHSDHALFLGRGQLFPIALEGALKLKEISYIHAEAYPTGELKHGPLALIDEEMPSIMLAPNDNMLPKNMANAEEILARKGKLTVLSDATEWKNNPQIHFIEMPAMPAELQPLCYNVALQLLSYHVAILKGTDIDQPRNLAKSVTVE